jgi:drug/metabolite transporter (DMT)-like permease
MKAENTQLAILLAIITTLLLSSLNALIKALGHHIDPFALIFYRNLFSMLPLLLWLKRKNIWPQFTAIELKQHFPRAVLGILSNICFIVAVQNMKLSDATAVSLSMPLFVSFLAPLLLKEKFNAERMGFVLAGFAGVLIILKPQGEMDLLTSVIALANPIFYALAIINLRHLSKTLHVEIIVFYYAFFSIVLTLPWAIWAGPKLDLNMIITLIALGFIGVVMQYTQTKSLELANASIIAPLNYLAIVWNTLLAIIFWHEWPNSMAWLGMALVVGMGLALNFMARPKKIIV